MHYADADYMRKAMELAMLGMGLVSPNPLVGAVVIRDGRVVGEGYHRYDQVTHAESRALEAAGQYARGATLYCNLEPCCHYGRTPPCSDAIIQAGVARVVVALSDPDPRVNGGGLSRLREAGISVEVGLREREAARLNESYLKYVTKGLPFVHAVIDLTERANDWAPATCTESTEARDSSGARAHWTPSSELREIASSYDAFLLGNWATAGRSIIGARLTRGGHRPIVIAGTPDVLLKCGVSAGMGQVPQVMALRVHSESKDAERSAPDDAVRSIGEDAGRSDLPSNAATLPSELESSLRTLAALRVTSVMILPEALPLDEMRLSEHADKLTLINWSESQETDSLDDAWVRRAADIIEVTGYPRRC